MKKLSLTLPSAYTSSSSLESPSDVPLIHQIDPTPRPQGRRRASVLSLPPSATISTNTTPATTSLLHRRDEDLSPSLPYADGPREVLPGVWLGSEDNARDWHSLAQHGITAILNVAKEVVDPFDPLAPTTPSHTQSLRPFQSTPNLTNAAAASAALPSPALVPTQKPTYIPANLSSGRPALHYLKLPWSHGQADLVDVGFPVAMDFVDAVLLRSEAVLVHCQCGISRSATLVIALVMRAAFSASPHVPSEVRELKGMQAAYAYVKNKSKWAGPNMSLIYQLLDYERVLKGGSASPASSSDRSEVGGFAPGLGPESYLPRPPHSRSRSRSRARLSNPNHLRLSNPGAAVPDQKSACDAAGVGGGGSGDGSIVNNDEGGGYHDHDVGAAHGDDYESESGSEIARQRAAVEQEARALDQAMLDRVEARKRRQRQRRTSGGSVSSCTSFGSAVAGGKEWVGCFGGGGAGGVCIGGDGRRRAGSGASHSTVATATTTTNNGTESVVGSEELVELGEQRALLGVGAGGGFVFCSGAAHEDEEDVVSGRSGSTPEEDVSVLRDREEGMGEEEEERRVVMIGEEEGEEEEVDAKIDVPARLMVRSLSRNTTAVAAAAVRRQPRPESQRQHPHLHLHQMQPRLVHQHPQAQALQAPPRLVHHSLPPGLGQGLQGPLQGQGLPGQGLQTLPRHPYPHLHHHHHHHHHRRTSSLALTALPPVPPSPTGVVAPASPSLFSPTFSFPAPPPALAAAAVGGASTASVASVVEGPRDGTGDAAAARYPRRGSYDVSPDTPKLPGAGTGAGAGAGLAAGSRRRPLASRARPRPQSLVVVSSSAATSFSPDAFPSLRVRAGSQGQTQTQTQTQTPMQTLFVFPPSPSNARTPSAVMVTTTPVAAETRVPAPTPGAASPMAAGAACPSQSTPRAGTFRRAGGRTMSFLGVGVGALAGPTTASSRVDARGWIGLERGERERR